MKVLIISSAFEGGGARRTVWELMRALQSAGAEVAMLVRARRAGDPPNVQSLRFGFERFLDRLDAIFGAKLDARHLGSILRLARIGPGDYDVVHLHVLRGTRGWISLRAVQRLARRLPTVWTFHDEWAIHPGLHVDFQRVGTPEQSRAILGTDRPVYRDHPGVRKARRHLLRLMPRPSAIICPSRHLKALTATAAHLRGVATYRVPHGLPFLTLPETAMPRDEARRALSLPSDAKIVMLVAARLDYWFKGTPLAFETLKQVRTANARLLVVGQVSEGIRARLPASAIYLGYLGEDAALARVYRAADIVMMPSLGENFPYVALESLACETPVAAFRVGGLAEIVGENERGFLARPFDTALLASGIDGLLEDNARRAACGAAGRRWVAEVCDVKRWIDEHLAVYRHAIADFARAGMGAGSSGG